MGCLGIKGRCKVAFAPQSVNFQILKIMFSLQFSMNQWGSFNKWCKLGKPQKNIFLMVVPLTLTPPPSSIMAAGKKFKKKSLMAPTPSP